MSIYTKKGDAGTTGLFGGSLVSKDDLQVWCYGSVDEASSALGVAAIGIQDDETKAVLREIQGRLFVVCAELASTSEGRKKLNDLINESDIKYLELLIDKNMTEYGPLTGFVLPGMTAPSAHLHVARTAVRRAERYVVQLNKTNPVSPFLMQYLNRLSDAIFALCMMADVQDVAKTAAKKISAALNNDNVKITGDDCVWERMANAAFEESRKLGVPVSYAISDAVGNLLYFKREPDALLVSINIAMNKCYTSAVMKMDTKRLGELTQPGCPLFGINVTDPRLIIFGGGIVLEKNGVIVGAVGVSGGSPEEDIQIARKSVEVFV